MMKAITVWITNNFVWEKDENVLQQRYDMMTIVCKMNICQRSQRGEKNGGERNKGGKGTRAEREKKINK